MVDVTSGFIDSAILSANSTVSSWWRTVKRTFERLNGKHAS